ncbi:hypothetical protein QBC45DRAFT_72185 [Copromyces sp. CBS 386.78]|nr:hypothetical protein QBC45DRAFT_72185 [Copromyces sp. CBS 386.78]
MRKVQAGVLSALAVDWQARPCADAPISFAITFPRLPDLDRRHPSSFPVIIVILSVSFIRYHLLSSAIDPSCLPFWMLSVVFYSVIIFVPCPPSSKATDHHTQHASCNPDSTKHWLEPHLVLRVFRALAGTVEHQLPRRMQKIRNHLYDFLQHKFPSRPSSG